MVRFVPKQFTLNAGIFFAASKKNLCLSIFHTVVATLFLPFYPLSQVIAKETVCHT